MKKLIVALMLTACSGAQVNNCPPNTAAVALACKFDVEAGRATKEECYERIERSCP